MNGDGLIDTNIAIGLLNDLPAVITHLQTYRVIRIPAVAIGELEYGAQRSGRRESNLARVEALIARMHVLDVGHETTRHCGRIRNDLRVKGRPLPVNDIWIAAVAMEHNLALITSDAHFREIDGLSLDFLTPDS